MLPYILFLKCIYTLALETASPGNQLCIGALSSLIVVFTAAETLPAADEQPRDVEGAPSSLRKGSETAADAEATAETPVPTTSAGSLATPWDVTRTTSAATGDTETTGAEIEEIPVLARNFNSFIC